MVFAYSAVLLFLVVVVALSVAQGTMAGQGLELVLVRASHEGVRLQGRSSARDEGVSEGVSEGARLQGRSSARDEGVSEGVSEGVRLQGRSSARDEDEDEGVSEGVRLQGRSSARDEDEDEGVSEGVRLQGRISARDERVSERVSEGVSESKLHPHTTPIRYVDNFMSARVGRTTKASNNDGNSVGSDSGLGSDSDVYSDEYRDSDVYSSSSSTVAVGDNGSKRSDIDNTTSRVLFDMVGFTISFTVRGTTNATVLLSSVGMSSPHRFWIYINHTLQHDTVIDTTGTEEYVVYSYPLTSDATSLLPECTYDIDIVKITEINYNSARSEVNYVQFHGLEVSEGAEIIPQDDDSNEAPTTSLQRKIEFIGDSIMAGYMNMCGEDNADELEQLGHYALESFALAWPYLVADSFHAQQHSIGIVCMALSYMYACVFICIVHTNACVGVNAFDELYCIVLYILL
jgi:hypothetical protein